MLDHSGKYPDYNLFVLYVKLGGVLGQGLNRVTNPGRVIVKGVIGPLSRDRRGTSRLG